MISLKKIRESNLFEPEDYFQAHKLWSKTETRFWTINFFIGTCVLYASRAALPICATVMAQEYGWNKESSGTVMSCFFWGYALTQVGAGKCADRYGGEKILSFTTLIWIFLTFFTPQLFDIAYFLPFYSLFFVLCVRVFTGVGQGFHLPCMASMISRHLKLNDKAKVFGFTLSGTHLGTAIAGGVGSLLLDFFGWRQFFQFAGLISFIWWILFRRLVSNKNFRLKVYNMGKQYPKPYFKAKNSFESLPLKENIDEKPINNERQHVVLPAVDVPWQKLLVHPSFWAAVVAQYSGANAYYTMFSWLPSYFHDNYPEAKGFVYNVIPSLGIVVTSVVAPTIAGRILAKGISLCLILVSLVSTTNYIIPVLIFTTAMGFRGLHHGGVAVNVPDFAPNHTGAVFGLFNSFSAITGFIGVFFAGKILQLTGNNWSMVFLFTALQSIVGAIVYGFLGTGDRII
ncbi:Solute carrier family 17 member 9 [Strongyloides ratti]|uniref:Solute carrier family 17 member 9 n=1 Tax=Strongyloides ratti TaxID=34506 RepID=A0A090LF98_STRRB|nr:Solute carrier family 17 member 9 [Strongyloides ratti]CEF68442.1 Solute carrier family 17 member 9 [Strongyloides ratti]